MISICSHHVWFSLLALLLFSIKILFYIWVYFLSTLQYHFKPIRKSEICVLLFFVTFMMLLLWLNRILKDNFPMHVLLCWSLYSVSQNSLSAINPCLQKKWQYEFYHCDSCQKFLKLKLFVCLSIVCKYSFLKGFEQFWTTCWLKSFSYCLQYGMKMSSRWRNCENDRDSFC